MSLLGLPDEILVKIVEWISSPYAMLGFALSCKKLGFLTCDSRIQDLKKRHFRRMRVRELKCNIYDGTKYLHGEMFSDEVGSGCQFADQRWIQRYQCLPNGELHGSYSAYQEIGNASILREQFNYADGKMEGMQFSYFYDDDLTQIGFLQRFVSNGRLNGLKITQKPYLVQEEEFVDGKVHGKIIISLKTRRGEIYSREIREYHHGIAHGRCDSYNETGDLQEIHNYVDGLKTGVQVDRIEDGHMVSMASMMDGYLHGESHIYDRTGLLVQKLNYRYGELHGFQWMLNVGSFAFPRIVRKKRTFCQRRYYIRGKKVSAHVFRKKWCLREEFYDDDEKG